MMETFEKISMPSDLLFPIFFSSPSKVTGLIMVNSMRFLM